MSTPARTPAAQQLDEFEKHVGEVCVWRNPDTGETMIFVLGEITSVAHYGYCFTILEPHLLASVSTGIEPQPAQASIPDWFQPVPDSSRQDLISTGRLVELVASGTIQLFKRPTPTP